jgi:putative addiction module antidote
MTELKPASQLKVTQIGNSLGVILPKELVAKLKVDKGDVLFVTDLPGGVMLTAYDEKIDRQLRIGRDLMARYRDTLRELAK